MPNKNARIFSDSPTQLKAIYLACRDLGHAWNFTTDTVVRDSRKKPVQIQRKVKCLRCEMERVDSYELPSFFRLTTRYIYPDGYLLARGAVPDRFSKADARAEHYRRLGGFD